MKKVGVIGLGDMGSGLAKNLLRNGFDTIGYDLSSERISRFKSFGGETAKSVIDVAKKAETVFVMVMTGDQAKAVIFDDGLADHLVDGSSIILTATVRPSEAIRIGDRLKSFELDFIDSPVSGGFPGAQSGTLTLMASGTKMALKKNKKIMEAVSETIHHVGLKPGDGQIVKACLQSLIGSIFSATFEAATLAAKAGVPGEVLFKVFSTSGAGSGVCNTALQNIINRKFQGTGSHISTMYKDLTISLDLARELGVPLHTASTAMQLFQAGKTRYPKGDNWVVTRVLEEIVGAELHRGKEKIS
ncbi:MAG: NAD(P)-dependent oxidoreductase [Pseudomonadota bacterium]|nr:NAD(P)-dependent oxidoreductase [Pseudomonadota bacterium]